MKGKEKVIRLDDFRDQTGSAISEKNKFTSSGHTIERAVSGENTVLVDNYEVIEAKDDSFHDSTAFMRIPKLYPDEFETDSKLKRVFELLENSLGELKEAKSEIKSSHIIESDSAVQRFFGFLPEMFCCRSIGDGFGLIVSSVFHAIQNREGIPLVENQIDELISIINKLKQGIYISEEEAIVECEKLENVGFNLDYDLINNLGILSDE